jgi:hypothetical protein
MRRRFGQSPIWRGGIRLLNPEGEGGLWVPPFGRLLQSLDRPRVRGVGRGVRLVRMGALPDVFHDC